MRILWVKAGGIVPADTGGRIRSLNILKELARRHSITVFTYYAEHFGDQHQSGELNDLADVVAIPIALAPERTTSDYVRYAKGLLSPFPQSMRVIGGEYGGRLRYFDDRTVRRRLASVIARGRFDVLVCDFIFPAGLIDWNVPCPKVLFTHNVEADLWRQQFEAADHPVKRFLYWKEWRALSAAERDYACLADSVITVSEQNRNYFSRYAGRERVFTIATGVDIEAFHPSDAPPSNSMVFTGSMDWMPNQDGVLYFVSRILPKIQLEVTDAELWIVGRYPSREVQDLAAEHIHVTGRVEDIRPYLQKSPAYIVPLRHGSGTRLKIFEAMAMGKAVVSTTLGAEGLPVTHGRDILIADHPQEFAAAVVRILQDREFSASLGRAARALVEQRFTWKAAATQFETILENAVGRASGLPASSKRKSEDLRHHVRRTA
ncbi:MAG TPA: glycosyltransferase [Bryobacteraceae bacterium]|nr:glycosyltransferase [Bryobacteraceae bacterium]